MSTKAVNRLFLTMLIVEAAVVFLIGATGLRLTAMGSLILNQLILFVPAVVFLAATGTKPGFIAHKRIRPVTPLLCLVFTGLCMPLIMVVNMISMLFVENEVNGLSYMLIDTPAWLMFLVIGILGPVNEEFLYRGIFYHSYRRTGRIVAAILMSSFLFGVMHLNFNQMSYAIVVGIMSALLVEATGSIVSGMIFHGGINCYNVAVMVLQRDRLAAVNGDTQALLNDSLVQLGLSYRQFLLLEIVIYGVVAIAMTALAVLLLYGMAALEHRKAEFSDIWKRRQRPAGEKKESLWTVSLVIAVVLSFLYMIAELVLPMIVNSVQ